MKLQIKKIITLIVLIVLGQVVQAQIPKEVMLGLKSGDDKTLAKYFNTTIELGVNEKEGIYSKAQAQQIVRSFFTKNKPSKFSIIHHGGDKEKARYAIGNLATTTGRYRVYFLFQTKESRQLIYQLRFEKE